MVADRVSEMLLPKGLSCDCLRILSSIVEIAPGEVKAEVEEAEVEEAEVEEVEVEEAEVEEAEVEEAQCMLGL